MDKYGQHTNTKKTLELEYYTGYAVYSIKRELKITYKQLAEIMGVNARTLERWKTNDKLLPRSAEKMIRLLWAIKKTKNEYLIENLIEDGQV